MATEHLAPAKVSSAKPKEAAYRLSDGKGLYLLVRPDGAKWWRLDYSHAGKRKTLSVGVYPAVGLADARRRAEEARSMVANGLDPSDARKEIKAERERQTDASERVAKGEPAIGSFEAVAREWFQKNLDTWASSHSVKIITRLEKDVFPWIGGKAVAEITSPDVLAVLRRIEGRGTLDTAHRASGNCSQVFRYAIANGLATRDPVPDLRGALPPARGENFASITDPAKVAELLRAIDAFSGTFVVRCALLLASLLFVRPGELRRAEWACFDLDKAEWGYRVSKTKTDHLVPLAAQAVVILRELHALTGQGRYVFPGRDTNKAMSEAAVNAALRRMGYDTKTEITGHGFRAMARTILHEELHQKPEVIEHQLAHAVSDSLGTAYNRTKFLKERKAMMQLWADYLEQLKAGAVVIPMHTAA